MIQVELEVVDRTLSHTLYRSRLRGSGEELVSSSPSPEHDTARALVRQGFSGPCQFFWRDQPLPASSFRDIHQAARWTIAEGKEGPRLVRWRGRTSRICDPQDRQE
jgi:hypothetical protein